MPHPNRSRRKANRRQLTEKRERILRAILVADLDLKTPRYPVPPIYRQPPFGSKGRI